MVFAVFFCYNIVLCVCATIRRVPGYYRYKEKAQNVVKAMITNRSGRADHGRSLERKEKREIIYNLGEGDGKKPGKPSGDDSGVVEQRKKTVKTGRKL